MPNTPHRVNVRSAFGAQNSKRVALALVWEENRLTCTILPFKV